MKCISSSVYRYQGADSILNVPVFGFVRCVEELASEGRRDEVVRRRGRRRRQ